MRSIGRLAVVTGTLVLGSACSDGAGTPPPDNTAPVANFEVPACTIDVACNFASTSTDDIQVTEWSWDFDGDGNPDANTANASFTYTTAADFNVSLTVRDAQGLSHTKTSTITIAPEAPVNTPPTAGFTHTCNAADCTFTSTSTDVTPGTIATYAWSFGDGATADVMNPSHSYTVAAATDFTVTLTVTDNEGATDVETQTVTVSPPPNTQPTAGFTHACNAAVCTFTSTSTDVAPGTIATHAWSFGDGGAADVPNPLHSYAITVPTDFTVTLTVTDNEGATDVETQTVTVSPPPPAAEGCITSGSRVDCALDITARSTVKLKLLGLSCDLQGQRITIPPPIGDQVFLSVCTRTVGDSTKIYGGPTDSAIVFEAGSQVRIRFNQGTPDADEPAVGPPAGRLEGTFPNWTISFEDGANPGGPGEPDFADVVLGVEAVAAP
ncbi:MAG: PKD domain-containing protein [Gemmatimonadales bacterium]